MALLSDLKNHPFDVDAHFDFSLVLTYALPISTLLPLVPAGLELDTHDDRLGFIAVAMVQTRGLRPSRLPSLFGRDFFLIGTRVFVRCPLASGKRLRGLYILRSQTNTKAMRVLGDVFTRYRYETIDVDIARDDGSIVVRAGAFHVDVDCRVDPDEAEPVVLPAGSPFSTWQDARRFAGPMPYTFSMLEDPGEVLVVEGVRSAWHPRAVRVRDHQVPFFAERGLCGAVLASAFVVEDVPYHWKAGRRERCRTHDTAAAFKA